jgi:hypothetical protein
VIALLLVYGHKRNVILLVKGEEGRFGVRS